MQKITRQNLSDIAFGAAVLGSGGGGETSLLETLASIQLDAGGDTTLISIDELSEDDLIMAVEFMGSPIVSQEIIPPPSMFIAVCNEVEKYYGKKPTVLFPAEAGGGNIFAPFIAAGELRLPILDADTMGRAFPKLQMTTLSVHGVGLCPIFLSDFFGNSITISVKGDEYVERVAREITVVMGSTTAVVLAVLQKKEASNVLVHGSISRALQLGQELRYAKKEGKNPISVLVEKCNGTIVGAGTISDLNLQVEKGFFKGTVTVRGDKEYVVHFQNEFLVAYSDNVVAASTPDLIVLFDSEMGTPISSDALVYGQRVSIVIFPSDPIWKTKKGLSIVGPRAMGYEFYYQTSNNLEVI